MENTVCPVIILKSNSKVNVIWADYKSTFRRNYFFEELSFSKAELILKARKNYL